MAGNNDSRPNVCSFRCYDWLRHMGCRHINARADSRAGVALIWQRAAAAEREARQATDDGMRRTGAGGAVFE